MVGKALATQLLLVSCLRSQSMAFAPAASHTRRLTVLKVATTPHFLSEVEKKKKKYSQQKQNDKPEKEEHMGAMVDLTGIAMSGLNGKALSLNAEDFPKSGEIRKVIPKACFVPDTARSLGYLSVSLAGTIACTACGIAMLGTIGTNMITLPIWATYFAVTGTVAMGLWVLAHECGHGAFSTNKRLQDTIGYILHSIMLVPYYSWQRSHAVHHRYTNHMELGETHVPDAFINESEGPFAQRQWLVDQLGKENGMKIWGGGQAFLHLIFGWPAYLLFGTTGGPDRGMTNHFFPFPLTKTAQPNKELFPGKWKDKVYKSDVGVVATVCCLIAWGVHNGFGEVMALYGGPLLVVNAWLVLYTWLQHTDVDVPHFSESDHNFIKGALHTIDRPYDKMDPWGAIDFLHHKIGSTHVAHHFDSSIPHYKADIATDAISKAFPQLYMYDPTPIPEALWRVCKGCTSVEKRGDKWIWRNDGLEDHL